jgi:hypothetical protein
MLSTNLKAIDSRFERTWLHRFLDGTPRLIFYSLFAGSMVVSLLSHAYRLSGFPPFFWLLTWPRLLLDVVLPGGFRFGAEVVANLDAAIIFSWLAYCALVFVLLLRESRKLAAAAQLVGPERPERVSDNERTT